jgi:PqqD family protein of HPr-rel-A system
MTDRGVEPARPRPHEAVTTEFLEPEAVLYDARTGDVHRLNASASAVWLLLDGETTVDDLAAELAEIFDVQLEQVEQAVHATLADLAARGLLADDGSGRAVAANPPRPAFLARPPDP